MLTKFTLRQIAYFVTAADKGTTAAAAAEYLMSQSSMSAALTDLEAALGVQLFIRHRGKGLDLTNTGRALLPEARRLLQAADEFRSRAGTLQDQLSGRLTVGCWGVLAPVVVPPLLQRFTALHPAVEVDFSEGSQAELHEQLLEGRIELAIMYDHEMPAGLAGTVMFRPVPQLLLRKDHRLAARSSVSLSEIADEPFIMLDVSPSRPLIQADFASVGVVPRVRFRSPNFDHIRALVQLGVGYSMVSMPIGFRPAHWNADVVTLTVEGPMPRNRVVVVNARQARLTRRAEAFRDVCLRHGAELDSGAGVE